MKEAREALYTENVLPKMDRVRDYFNSWLLPMFDLDGAYWTYDTEDIEALADLFQQAKDAQHARAREDWMAGGITLNEYREVINQKPLDDGDCLRIGGILVSTDSLGDYADQSLTKPAGPPMPQAEPLNIPGANPNTPQLPAPKQQVAQPPAPVNGQKYMGANGIYQPDNLQAQLNDLAAKGIQYVTWVAGKNTCDICLQNNGVTRLAGLPFPSGHILPQAHPNCDCSIVPAAKSIDLDLLVKVFAEYLLEREREKISHDFNSKTVNDDRRNVQLPHMQIQPQAAQEAGIISTNHAAERDNVPQGDTNIYPVVANSARNGLKTFLELYNL